ncbi:DUF4241 domain-containing protein [uncultured Winogradskyella sp.]|uniref:DUF4241 domain-containing protein n=1 Tax=uncultured Winogradskyella sp. TaxID=395353 RepID=UPI002604F7EC|nr:DUF4241 domain-containing protein [uncultured Winogradskyella sp.]
MKLLITIIIGAIIILFFLFKQKKEEVIEKEKETKLHLEKNKDSIEVLSHADYNIIFENTIVENIPIEVLEIGNLNVPSEQIVVCDPLVFYDVKPLVKKIKPGVYPVKIYVAKTEYSGDRFAIAKLEITDNKAVKWILATTADQDLNTLQSKDEYFGFPVDAGLGGFLDYKTALAYERFCNDFHKKYPNKNIYDDFFAAEFKKNAKDQNDPNDIGDWINYTLPNTDLNITMFHSGYGDGYYPAYWGIDKNGNVSSLVIDFFVLLSGEE